MSDYWDKRERIENFGTVTVSGTTPVVKAFGRRVAIKRFILVTTTAQTVANDTVTLAKRKVDNSSSANLGTFLATFSGSALNEVRYVNIAEPPTTAESGTTPDQFGRSAAVVYNDGPGLLLVDPDEEIVLTPGGGATAGAYEVWVQFQDLGFDPADINITVDELTFTHA